MNLPEKLKGRIVMEEPLIVEMSAAEQKINEVIDYLQELTNPLDEWLAARMNAILNPQKKRGKTKRLNEKNNL